MKNNKGFTLVEVIISIAVLSILCVIFLQLFVKASDISESSNELDQSIILTNSTMELMKKIGHIEAIESSKYFNEFEIKQVDQNLSLVKTFDKDFKYSFDEPVYIMEVSLTQNQNIENSSIHLYDISCDITKLEDNKNIYHVLSKIILE